MNEPLDQKYQEIIRLERLLSVAGIRHRIERCFDGWRIAYPDDETKCVCSVIEHRASMGSSRDRLEIKGLLNKEERKFDQVVGHLTAENVFSRIRTDWDRRQAKQ